jgi:antitoxin HicB
MYEFGYPILLTPDESDGGYVATCRDVPEAITQGETVEGALADAAGALQAALESRITSQMDIPRPTPARTGDRLVAVPVGTALKTAVYLAMCEQHVSKSDLARRLGVDEKEVRRALDPRHPTKAPRLEEVLRALGRSVEVRVI